MLSSATACREHRVSGSASPSRQPLQSDAFTYLRNSNSQGIADIRFDEPTDSFWIALGVGVGALSQRRRV